MAKKLLTIYRAVGSSLQQIVVSVVFNGFDGGAGQWDQVCRVDFFDPGSGDLLGIFQCDSSTSSVTVSSVDVVFGLGFIYLLGTPTVSWPNKPGFVGNLQVTGIVPAFVGGGAGIDGQIISGDLDYVVTLQHFQNQTNETSASLSPSDLTLLPPEWAGHVSGNKLFYRIRNLFVPALGGQRRILTLERNIPEDQLGLRRLPQPFDIPIAMQPPGPQPVAIRAVQRPTDGWLANTTGSATNWIIDVNGFHEGTISDFWQRSVVDRYVGAMQSVSDVEPVSLLPNFPGAQNDADWRLQVPLKLQAGAYLTDGPSSLQLLGPLESKAPSNNPVTVSCDGFLTHTGTGLGFTATIVNNSVGQPTTPWIGMTLLGVSITGVQDALRVRIGSIDLSFDPGKAATLRMNCTLQFDQAGKDFWIPRVSLSGSMPLSDVQPGGQDDPGDPQFASAVAAVEASGLNPYATTSLSQPYAREAALLVPIPPASASLGSSASGLTVQLKESSASRQNHHLVLTVSCQTTGTASSNDVLVIDRNPFTVALARLPNLASTASADTNQIAQWSNSFPEGAGWRISAGAGSFELLLPPQGVGEAMVTGSPGTPGEPQDQDTGPIDFRLAPPAQAVLQTSGQLQRFSEPGWNLRRILGYPGERAPGAVVGSLQFEMLFGLTCNVTTAGLKMSEMFSRLGGFAGPLVDAATGTMGIAPSGGYTESQSKWFGTLNDSWGATYKQMLSRLGILELWNQERGFDLLLTDGVSYDLRTSAGMAPPGSTATNLFHGGMAYALDPAIIYPQILKNPHSSSALLINPRFSALGGYGKQRAAFINDKVIVESDVAMGFLNSLSVTVIGRIGNLWHHAKHVTVYERSVHASRQFYLEQPVLAGRPILRKVSEYVEIVQKARSYPESGSALGCGFLQGAEFKSIRINVDSRWGTNIGSSGWSIPLWRRDAVPADVYPRPQLLFQMATDPATGNDSAMCEMVDPEKLCFYADLSTATSQDTETWPALENIDYCTGAPWRSVGDASAPPRAQNDFSVEPGFGRFTYAVAADASHVNVVSQRAADAMASALRTLTFMRAQSSVTLPADPLNDLQANAGRLHDFVNNALDELSTAATAAALAAKDPAAAIKTRLAQADIQNGLVKPLAAACVIVGNANTSGLCGTLAGAAGTAIGLAAAPVEGAWQSLFSTAQKELIASANAAQVSLKQALLGDVDGVFIGIKAAMGTLLSDLTVAGTLSTQLPSLSTSIVNDLGSLQNQITTGQTGFRDTCAVGIRRCQDDLNTFIDDLQQLMNSATFLFGSRAMSSPTVANAKGDLSNFCGSLSAAFTAALTVLADTTEAAADINSAIDKVKQLLPPTVLMQDLGTLATALSGLGAVANPFLALVTQLRDSLRSAIQNVPTTAAADYVQAITQTFSTWVQGDFDTLVKQTTANVTSQVSNACSALLGSLSTAANNIGSFLDPGAITTAITQYLSGSDYAGAIEGVRTAYVSQLDGVVQRIRDLGPAPGIGTDTGLSLLRAFGAPPVVPTLSFDSTAIAYFYTNARQTLANGVTTLVNDVVQEVPVSAGLTSGLAQASSAFGDIPNPLQQLGIGGLPTRAVLDRLVPDVGELAKMQLADLFPNLAGLSLDSLFSGLTVPPIAGDNIHISHHVDPQTLRASLDVALNFPISASETTVFSIGPATVSIESCVFQAAVHIAGGVGQSVSRTSSGSITGDWHVSIAGTEIITFLGTALSFDEAGHLHFDIEPARVRLAAVLEFLADFVEALDLGGGFSLNLLPTGIQCVLELPFPDMSFGAFGITNLSLGCLFQIDFSPFAITVGANLGQQESPFTLTIFILGGAGWFEASVTYIPDTCRLQADVSIGILASASLSISLGPISGGVYIYFGITAEFHSGGGLDIGILIMIQGRVSLLGILDIDITLLLEAEYTSGGGMIGRGEVDASIKICWCFTLEVHKSVQFTFGSASGGSSGQRAVSSARAVAAMPAADPTLAYAQAATNRINFLT